MHILLGLFGLIMFVAVWWYRMKYMSEAVGEAAKVIGQVQGKIRTGKLRKKAALAPIASIDDPVTAAATIMAAIIAEDSVFSPLLENSVRAQLEQIATGTKLDEAMVYAKWASEQVANVTSVIDVAGKYLATKLSNDEKHAFVEMVMASVPADKRHVAFADRIKRLRQKLGFQVN
jgi:predicted DNA-binding ribbon-helix-helix protein